MDKACPVVLRNQNRQVEILAFRHPLAGIQLAKGTVERGESSQRAAERELYEESGISLNADSLLLDWQRRSNEPVWRIWKMEPGDHLPDKWSHFCEDDGGHLFEYFWHPLMDSPGSDWHYVFVDALYAIREAIEPD